MTPELPPERVQALLDDLAHWTNDAVLDEPVEAEEWDDAAPLTRRELRALLAAHGKTCEWHEMPDGSLITDCGREPVRVATHTTRPCWCGGRVVIRDGGTT